ncbi:MAG: apolipoprotein N-acyltransferase [bacterium]|nr:apolipoprotein N-acyltransferase [bacterium]
MHLVIQKKWLICLAVILSGILLGISQPVVISNLKDTPIDESGLIGLLVFLAYIPVFLVVNNKSVKQTFWLGFFAALIQYVIILYWFIVAMTVFGGISFWFSALVLLTACSILACYIGVAFAVAQLVSRYFSWSIYYVLPVAICAVEYIRNFIFLGGFPWGASAYALADIPLILQSVSLVGVYGLVFYIILVNAALAALCFSVNKPRHKSLRSFIIVTSFVTVVFLVYGNIRLNNYEPDKLNSINVALLQGNIEQGIKNKTYLYAEEILQKFQKLQKQALQKPVDLVIWPEASFPYRVNSSNIFMPHLKGEMPAAIVGGVFYEEFRMPGSAKLNTVHYNTALIVAPDLKIEGRFDKNHLVPFGEYVPWPFMQIANKVVPGLGVFGRGGNFNPIKLPLLNHEPVLAGVTICYEGVFPEMSREFVINGAQILVNITNDAWYGVSSAPYQHLNMYKLRAVENGRSYIRATNTGVSGIVNSRGRVTHQTQLYEDAVVNATVFLDNDHTIYSFIGDMVGYLSLIFMTFILALALVGRDVFIRRRTRFEWALGIFGFALMVASSGYFADAKSNWDESAFTKDTFITGFGFLMGTASLCGKAWGRKVLLWLGALAFILCTLIASVEGYVYLFGSITGFTLFIITWFGPWKRN